MRYETQIREQTSTTFGSAIKTRSYSSGAYRYGFQNQEKDDEIWGEGNGVSFKYRIHDARLGRFLSVDPLSRKFPWNSNYAFSENRLLYGIEFEGLEVVLLGVQGTAGAGVNVSVEVGVILDGSGNVYAYTTGQLGIVSNVSVSFMISMTFYPTMINYEDALGWGGAAEVSLGEGLLLGAGVSYSSSGHFGWIFALGGGAGLSPVSGSAGVTYTSAKKLNKDTKEEVLKTMYKTIYELGFKQVDIRSKINSFEVDNQLLNEEITQLEIELTDESLSENKREEINKKIAEKRNN